MTFCFYMNCVSAHQVPLAREVAKLVGSENFVYVDAGQAGQPFQTVTAESGITVRQMTHEARELLLKADVVLTGLRDFDLLERRSAAGKRTFYCSERWLKPSGRWPGWLRLLVPCYRRMARRFVRWANEDPYAQVLAVGPWAEKDFLKLGVRREKIVPWGYFVEPGHPELRPARDSASPTRLLWVGRMLNWKRVDTIVRAMAELERRDPGRFTLTLVGEGPEQSRLKRLARNLPISFLPRQSRMRVRELMREHDIYVLSSSAQEGWGAAVNEALEEGMLVVGTHEAGASATLLPSENRFPAGNRQCLTTLLVGGVRRVKLPEAMTPYAAAKRLETLNYA